MRDLPYINELWDRGGPFIGEDRPNGFVTVEPSWYLNVEGNPGKLDTSRRPVRWWQRSDNSQEEKEIPNVLSIETNRSLDSDAGEATITILNTLPRYNNETESNPKVYQWGQRGALVFNYGQDSASTDIWGHERNEWFRILRPGSLIRTYQGYGGINKTREQALIDGNVALTGVWRTDSVEFNTDGNLVLQCRDMAGLLIDQHLYPPIVPAESYPLHFFPYTYETRQISNPPAPPRSIRRPLRYLDSSADRWYGANANIHGHRGSHSVDGNNTTFALSVGNSHPSREFCTDWFEYGVNEQINSINMMPWRGNYTMYVSVMENGRWQGTQTVPYNFGSLSHQPGSVDTGANIPFVAKFQVPWEQSRRYQLPRTYSAQRVRISFRNHTRTQWGPWLYRAGIREVYAEMYEASPAPMWADITGHPSGHGYWAVSEQGRIQTFGDAVNFGETGKSGTVSIEAMPSGEGYWILHRNGTVSPFGDASWYGNANIDDAVDIVAYSDYGYWIISRNGGVYSFGDAPSYGSIPGNAVRGAKVPNADGLFVVHVNGTVSALGSAVHVDDGNPASQFVDIVPRDTGYFLVRSDGEYMSFGAGSATTVWEPDQRPPIDPVAAIGSPTVGLNPVGYGTLTRTGQIGSRSEFTHLGDPASGVAQVRRPGNFSDLTEIVKLLLLWSGFWLQGGNGPSEDLAVYGNLEYTGFTPESSISADVFDKKPVIDAITYLKEITGFNFFVDQEGAVRYGSPNIWGPGNFMADGTHVNKMLQINERHNLINYLSNMTLKHERKFVTVTDGDPLSDAPGVRSYRHRAYASGSSNDYLFGVEANAQVVVPVSLTERELETMAKLIALRIRLKRRSGAATCAANPALELDDQVSIYERTSNEIFIHYVHGISTSQDFQTGSYTMDVQTHWMSAIGSDWSIRTTEDQDTWLSGEPREYLEDLTMEVMDDEIRHRATNRISDVGPVREPDVYVEALDSVDDDENGGSAT